VALYFYGFVEFPVGVDTMQGSALQFPASYPHFNGCTIGFMPCNVRVSHGFLFSR
jgi:hypothetical protein